MWMSAIPLLSLSRFISPWAFQIFRNHFRTSKWQCRFSNNTDEQMNWWTRSRIRIRMCSHSFGRVVVCVVTYSISKERNFMHWKSISLEAKPATFTVRVSIGPITTFNSINRATTITILQKINQQTFKVKPNRNSNHFVWRLTKKLR